MKVLFDHNLSRYIARGLNEIFAGEHLIVALEEHFGQSDLTDLEWISRLGNEGNWSVISADVRITRNRVERNAFLSADLVGFFLSPGLRKSPVHIQAARLLRVWPRIVAISENVERGLFELPLRGEKFRQLRH